MADIVIAADVVLVGPDVFVILSLRHVGRIENRRALIAYVTVEALAVLFWTRAPWIHKFGAFNKLFGLMVSKAGVIIQQEVSGALVVGNWSWRRECLSVEGVGTKNGGDFVDSAFAIDVKRYIGNDVTVNDRVPHVYWCVDSAIIADTVAILENIVLGFVAEAAKNIVAFTAGLSKDTVPLIEGLRDREDWR